MPDLDYPKLIKEQELELSGLHTRMDDDRKLLYLNKYELQDANKKKGSVLNPALLVIGKK